MELGVHFIDFRPGDPAGLGPTLAAAAKAAEDGGGATMFTLADHLFQMEAVGRAEDPFLEGYTSMGGFLAGRTERITLAMLVTGGVTYRHPGVLAKTMTTLDVLAQGRSMFGIGAHGTSASTSPSACRIRRCATGSRCWRRRCRSACRCGARTTGRTTARTTNWPRRSARPSRCAARPSSSGGRRREEDPAAGRAVRRRVEHHGGGRGTAAQDRRAQTALRRRRPRLRRNKAHRSSFRRPVHRSRRVSAYCGTAGRPRDRPHQCRTTPGQPGPGRVHRASRRTGDPASGGLTSRSEHAQLEARRTHP